MIELILLFIMNYHGTCVLDDTPFRCDLTEHIPDWFMKMQTQKFPYWLMLQDQATQQQIIEMKQTGHYYIGNYTVINPDAMNIAYDYLIQKHIIYSTYCGSWWGSCTQ